MIEALIGLVGVLVGSFITVLKDSWASRRERRRDGSYAAIRLICILEEYADKCIDVVQDDGRLYGLPAGCTNDGEEYLVAQVSAPEPPDFPDDIAWRSLDEPLMHRILALPNKARSTDQHIAVAADFASPPFFESVFGARHEGYARLGNDALNIVTDLRREFGIAANSRIEMSSDWNPATFLKKKVAEIKAHEAGTIAQRSERDGTEE